ncbi:MAG: type II secretion system F family protein [Endomicrobium sp.]|jgi:tight adherence protein C|nr:type II secretion system F family protein [Endomicrobium sp.]MDR2818374.1 type II secretion system F family protein [Endomicrobium sp.]
MIALLCFFWFFAVFFAVYCIVSNVKKAKFELKIKNAIEKRKTGSFITNYFFIIIDKISCMAEKIKYKKFVYLVEKNDATLKLLGKKYENITPYRFFAIQVFAMFVGILFAAFFVSLQIIVVISIGLFFFYLPVLKIKEELTKRKESILKQLPEMADLISVMLAAGLDFYSASRKVVSIMSGSLIDELKNALAKISLGYDKRAAFKEMAESTGVEQVYSFVSAINMALESGTEMSDILKRLSCSLRNENFSYAEKKAQEAPVKILIPLVLLIFPTIFIVIFGPIAISFIKNGF